MNESVNKCNLVLNELIDMTRDWDCRKYKFNPNDARITCNAEHCMMGTKEPVEIDGVKYSCKLVIAKACVESMRKIERGAARKKYIIEVDETGIDINEVKSHLKSYYGDRILNIEKLEE